MAWEIFTLTNKLRTEPKYFIEFLEARLPYFDERNILWLPGKPGLLTREGPAAVQEAIDYLAEAGTQPVFEWRSGMARACEDHVADTGAKGLTGHSGSDDSSPYDRMNRYGKWGRWAAENISYGQTTGMDVVLQLLIDDGVTSRGHRKNLFSEYGTVTGVASGVHDKYDTMSCITYAGTYENSDA